MMKYSWKSKLYTFMSCVFFMVLWQSIATVINNDIYLPKINQIIDSIISICNTDGLIKIIISSMYRAILSYTLALIFSVILGVLAVMYPFFKYLLRPINSFSKTMPTMVLVVLSLIWFDKDITPFVVGFAIIFPILYEGIINNLIKIDKKILDMAKVYEVSVRDKFIKIYIPIIKFYFMSIFISTFSLTFKVVIAGEVYGQPKFGIGSQIQIEKVNFNTPGIFAWIVIIVIISLVLEVINMILNKKIYRWIK